MRIKVGEKSDSRARGGTVPIEAIGDLLCATQDTTQDLLEEVRGMSEKLDRLIEAVDRGTQKATESLRTAEDSLDSIDSATRAIRDLTGALDRGSSQ